MSIGSIHTVFSFIAICSILTACTTDHGAAGKDDPDDGDTARNGVSDDEVEVQGEAFDISASLSPVIGTVVIVEWTAEVPSIDSAYIEFGPDTTYGMRAPVDLDESDYRTLLLGLKPSATVHFRVVAVAGERTLGSDDQVIETGAPPTGLPNKTVTMNAPEQAEDVFKVAATFSRTDGWAFIVDAEGDYVWWYSPTTDRSDWARARMTYDGRHMLIANTNFPSRSSGILVKVSMDGLDEVSYPLKERHHDVTVLPFDDIITYFEYETEGTGTCDRIMEMTPDGESREVFRLREHFSHRADGGEWCHSNAINYVEAEDAYYLSVLEFNSIIKIDRSSATVVWELGGEESDFEGLSWNAQHQYDVLDDSILIFNNRGTSSGGFNNPSRVIEYRVDDDAYEAELVWEYTSGTLNSMALGDAKRLPNGNTLIVYSTAGVIQEVDGDKALLSEISWGMGGAIGYITYRRSLYGPPEAYL